MIRKRSQPQARNDSTRQGSTSDGQVGGSPNPTPPEATTPPSHPPPRLPSEARPNTRENQPRPPNPSPTSLSSPPIPTPGRRGRTCQLPPLARGARACHLPPRPCPCSLPVANFFSIAFAGAPLSLELSFPVRSVSLTSSSSRLSLSARPPAIAIAAPPHWRRASGVRRPRPSRPTTVVPSATDEGGDSTEAILLVSSRPRSFVLTCLWSPLPLLPAVDGDACLAVPPRGASRFPDPELPGSDQIACYLKATARGQAMGIEVEAKQDARCSIKKTLRCSIRTSWRCASEHWAIFSLVLLLYLLYKYTPGFFAFLLSTSPVIICTSLLLAVLLCHGSAHLPEIREDRKAPEQGSAGSSSRNVRTEEQQRFSVPTLKKNIAREASFGRMDWNKHADLDENVPLLKQEAATEEYMKYNAEKESKGAFSSKDEYANSFDDMHRNTVDGEEATLGLCSSSENVSEDVKVVAKPDDQGKVSAYAQSGEAAEISDHKSADGTPSKCKWGRAFSVRRRKKLADIKVEAINSVVDNQLDHSLCSPFDTFGSHDNSSSGFHPDNAERHSPDVSMTDTAPVLDETETGPPLGVDCSCPDRITNDDSGNHSNISSLDSQPQTVNNEVTDNNKAKVDGEEKDDAGTEPALLWTADNEKNVMDLGYSEIERNRRLETLMVKRKSRKNIQFDLDGMGGVADDVSRFRPQVQPISVSARRMNPFADDAEIPGSAPPILHSRDNNPFDFLTDEQSDDSGLPAPDNLEPQEPMPVLHQDALFRRHESFSFGRPPQSQRHGPSRFKPCFSLEEFSLDEASSSSFQRQFSDRSVSRLSVVSECDTVSSVGDQEHNDLIRNYIRGVRESSPSLLGQDGGGGDAVCAAGNECSDGVSSFVDNEALNAVIC